MLVEGIQPSNTCVNSMLHMTRLEFKYIKVVDGTPDNVVISTLINAVLDRGTVSIGCPLMSLSVFMRDLSAIGRLVVKSRNINSSPTSQ